LLPIFVIGTILLLMLNRSHLLAVTLLWAVPALAEEPKSDPAYETVVTAMGSEETAFESPRAIEVVNDRELKDRPPATTPEALENEPGVYMQRTNTGGGTPILRGLLGQHVLLLVDGVRLNNSITRFGPNQLLNTVDPFQIARIEVVRGPGSVLYGSDALGGVINLIGRRPAFDPRRAWDAAAELNARFDSADMSAMGNLGLEGHLRGFGLRVGGTLKRFGELSGGRDTGTQPFTAYREADADVSLAWALDTSHMLRASYTAVRQLDAPRTDRSSPTDFRLFTEQYRDLGSLSYSGRFDGFLLKQVDASLSLHDQRELRERFRVNDDRIERERDEARTLGAQVTARGELPYTQLTVGLNVYHDWVDSAAEHEQISSPVITPLDRGRYVDDATYTQLGFYLLDRIPITRKLAIDVGGRVSSWIIRIPQSRINEPIDTSRTGLVGALHARYLVGDGLNLVAGVSQGFRAPNVDDFSAQGCSGQGYDVPNPDLENEKSVTAEAGVKLDLFGMLTSSLFYYYTYLNDLIVRVPAGGPQVQCGTLPDGRPDLADRVTRDNAKTGEIHGVELSVRLELGRRWSLFSWAAWSRGHVTLDLPGNFEEPLGRVPPLNGMAGVRYDFGDQLGFAELGLRWADRQDRLATGDRSDRRICPNGAEGCRGTPGYAVVTLRGAARIHDYLRLTLAVENLTNETYRIHGSGIDGAGVSAIVGMEVEVR
jgi:outer membrane receptor protein involved in Fe transport